MSAISNDESGLSGQSRFRTAFPESSWKLVSYGVLFVIIAFVVGKYGLRVFRSLCCYFCSNHHGPRGSVRRRQRRPPQPSAKKLSAKNSEDSSIEKEPMLMPSTGGKKMVTQKPEKSAAESSGFSFIKQQQVEEIQRQEAVELNKKATLNAKRFELLWQEQKEIAKWGETMEKHQIDMNHLIETFEEVGIVCMASGTVQNQHKGFFFASPVKLPNKFVLVEVVVNSNVSNQVHLTVKSESALNEKKDVVAQHVLQLVRNRIKELL